MTQKYDVVLAVADDHFFIDGSADDAEKEPAHVWGFGIVTKKTSRGFYVASAGAKFKSERVTRELAQTSTHYFRRPAEVRKIGSVEF